ncbi:hypothetical protein [Blastococcus sp. VKM Ac-2987]|uniref:hypothetical protein n=1 Tax=Blastococcus sp. VKM Ac-2987 TaxID=3004141 RepID=UPI0022AB93B0|nr:hypothetical protein [Blastococcus sp. VKM Ac-2987]MCZ2859127.1 hypothetical protein [Blastococcus sp. VKM Ac-2987]
MPASPLPPSDSGPPTPQKPPSVRVAVALLATLAALILLYVVISLLGWDGLVTALTEAGLTREEAQRYLLINTTAPGSIGLVYAVSAWGLATRRSWARWTGLAAAVVLALILVSAILSAGGVTVISLLLLVLSVAAATSLVARTTRDWLAAGPDGRAATA